VVAGRALPVVLLPELLAFLEARSFLVAGDVVLCARIHVVAARPPGGLAITRPISILVQRRARLLRRAPGASALEPVQRHIRLRLLELRQRGQQVFPVL